MLAVGVLQGIAAGSLLHVTFYEVKYLFLLHSIEYIFKDMSCPVVIMHYIIL